MDSAERRFNALDFLLDYSKGTLWWVKDCVWKDADPTFVVKHKAHAGLSVCRRKVEGLYSCVPMLVGTTKGNLNGCNVAVRDVFPPERRNWKNTTYFCALRPTPICFDEFGSCKSVSMNENKPHITAEESRQLDRFLKFQEV